METKKQLNYDVPSETVVVQSIVEFFTVFSTIILLFFVW